MIERKLEISKLKIKNPFFNKIKQNQKRDIFGIFFARKKIRRETEKKFLGRRKYLSCVGDFRKRDTISALYRVRNGDCYESLL